MTRLPAKFSENMGPNTPQQRNSLRVKRDYQTPPTTPRTSTIGTWGSERYFPEQGDHVDQEAEDLSR